MHYPTLPVARGLQKPTQSAQSMTPMNSALKVPFMFYFISPISCSFLRKDKWLSVADSPATLAFFCRRATKAWQQRQRQTFTHAHECIPSLNCFIVMCGQFSYSVFPLLFPCLFSFALVAVSLLFAHESQGKACNWRWRMSFSPDAIWFPAYLNCRLSAGPQQSINECGTSYNHVSYN